MKYPTEAGVGVESGPWRLWPDLNALSPSQTKTPEGPVVRNLLVPHSDSLNWFCSDPAAALNTPLAVYSELHFYFPILIVCVCVSAVSL